jgi:hypothetical protein
VYRLILALILFGFVAFVYQGVVHSDREPGPEAATPTATLARP